MSERKTEVNKILFKVYPVCIYCGKHHSKLVIHYTLWSLLELGRPLCSSCIKPLAIDKLATIKGD